MTVTAEYNKQRPSTSPMVVFFKVNLIWTRRLTPAAIGRYNLPTSAFGWRIYSMLNIFLVLVSSLFHLA